RIGGRGDGREHGADVPTGDVRALLVLERVGRCPGGDAVVVDARGRRLEVANVERDETTERVVIGGLGIGPVEVHRGTRLRLAGRGADVVAGDAPRIDLPVAARRIGRQRIDEPAAGSGCIEVAAAGERARLASAVSRASAAAAESESPAMSDRHAASAPASAAVCTWRRSATCRPTSMARPEKASRTVSSNATTTRTCPGGSRP